MNQKAFIFALFSLIVNVIAQTDAPTTAAPGPGQVCKQISIFSFFVCIDLKFTLIVAMMNKYKPLIIPLAFALAIGCGVFCFFSRYYGFGKVDFML